MQQTNAPEYRLEMNAKEKTSEFYSNLIINLIIVATSHLTALPSLLRHVEIGPQMVGEMFMKCIVYIVTFVFTFMILKAGVQLAVIFLKPADK